MNMLQTRKSLIGETFASIHEEHGFVPSFEQPPYPSPDPTVLFVGAQISIWKPRLSAIASGEDEPSYCPQNCIRMQNKNYFLNDTPITFNSFFKMHGAIGPRESLNETVHVAEEFLSCIGVSDDRILIKANSMLAQQFNVERATLLIDSEQPTYYSWNYGDPELLGAGATIAIRSEYDDSSFDVGNIIVISKNGKPLAVEWGFGEETLINAMQSDDLPIRYADMPDNLRVQLISANEIKYTDALIASVRMAGLGVSVSERGAGGALHEYVRGSAYLAAKIGKSILSVESDISLLSEHFDLSTQRTSALSDKMQYYMGRIHYLKKYLTQNLNQSPEHSLIVCRQIGVPQTIGQLLITKEVS